MIHNSFISGLRLPRPSSPPQEGDAYRTHILRRFARPPFKGARGIRKPALRSYFPLNFAGLFSRNAVMPSFWSSVAKHLPKLVFSSSMASAAIRS